MHCKTQNMGGIRRSLWVSRMYTVMVGALVTLAVLVCGTATASCEIDLVIAIDSSASILEGDPLGQPLYNWHLMKNFSNDVIFDLYQYQTRIGMIVYSRSHSVEIPLDNDLDHQRIEEHLSTVRLMGKSTNTAGAIVAARRMFRDALTRKGRRQVLLLITDGLSDHPEATRLEAQEARSELISIYTLGISDYVNFDELRHISLVQNYILHVPDFSRLQTVKQSLVDELCGPLSCNEERYLDIVFLIDSSGSIRDNNPDNRTDNYQVLKGFVTELVAHLDIGEDANQVAALIFSTETKLLFDLDDLYNVSDITNATLEAEYLGSRTNISGALRTADQLILQEENGDRPDVDNVVILITDGHSTVDADLTIPEANHLKDNNATVFVVGITNNVNLTEVHSIASEPFRQHYFEVDKIDDLQQFVFTLIYQVCSSQDDRRR